MIQSMFMQMPMIKLIHPDRMDMMNRAFVLRHRRPPKDDTPVADWWPELLIDDKIILIRKFYLPRRPFPQASERTVDMITRACQDVTISMLNVVLPIYEEFNPEDRRLHKASDIAKAYREDPSVENREKCKIAANFANDISMSLYYEGLEKTSDPNRYYTCSHVASAASHTLQQTFGAAAFACESAERTMRQRAKDLDLEPVWFDFGYAEDRIERLLAELNEVTT